jgi:hypothetical protein
MFKKILLASAMLAAGITSAQAVTLFTDNFNGEALGINKPALANWSVSNGSIDVIGPGFFGLYGPGRYIDMDGSTLNAGRIDTTQTFNVSAGKTYTISFSYGKNGIAAETLNFGLGTLTGSLVLAAGGIGSLISTSYSFLATSNQSNVSLFFEGLGGDNRGAVLDNVSLSAVPLPAALPLLLAGLAGVAGLGRLRRKPIA